MELLLMNQFYVMIFIDDNSNVIIQMNIINTLLYLNPQVHH